MITANRSIIRNFSLMIPDSKNEILNSYALQEHTYIHITYGLISLPVCFIAQTKQPETAIIFRLYCIANAGSDVSCFVFFFLKQCFPGRRQHD